MLPDIYLITDTTQISKWNLCYSKYYSTEDILYIVGFFFFSFKVYLEINNARYCQKSFHLSPCLSSACIISFVWGKRKKN